MARERGFRLQDHALALYVVCEKPECEGRRPPTPRHAHTDA
jgi:Fe2+ or Zn2+ uptake regulation protein